ncbi:unnamed protein product [Dicrocoelium dendriticum]|nr:unnamed protein product [Dicrocoelium dendriticum]
MCFPSAVKGYHERMKDYDERVLHCTEHPLFPSDTALKLNAHTISLGALPTLAEVSSQIPHGDPELKSVKHHLSDNDNADRTQSLKKPFLTPEGKIWPAKVQTSSTAYFCSKFTKERLESILRDRYLKLEYGKSIDIWILTRIDHWDHDQECTICLTDTALIFMTFNFITEQITWQRTVPLNSIHTLRLGNLVSPPWSFLP